MRKNGLELAHFIRHKIKKQKTKWSNKNVEGKKREHKRE